MERLRNPRHELFAIEVAAGTPLDRAYVAAGYKGGKWGRPNGAKLAQNPKVALRISKLQRQHAVQGGLQAAYIQAKLLPLLEADFRQLFEKDSEGRPRLRKLTDLPDDIAAALSSVKVDETGTIHDFKLANKTDAARTLLQSIGAIIEQHAHAHAHIHAYDSLADRLNAARARVRERAVAGGSSVNEAFERYPNVEEKDVADAADIAAAMLTLSNDDQRALAECFEAAGEGRAADDDVEAPKDRPAET